LDQLKAAHQAQDLGAIDSGMEALNKAWEAASQEIYNATQGAVAQPGADAGAGASAESGDGVSDVDYEEVSEDKK